jgi:integrase
VSCGRAPGPGSLRKRPLPAGGASWTLTFTDASGRRRRVVLGADKRVAEMRRSELIRQRDLELAGLGGVSGQSRPLEEIRDLYLQDLRHRSSARHALNVQGKLDRILGDMRSPRVRDVTPAAVMAFRGALVDGGLSHRTANCYVGTLRALLSWAVEASLIAENPILRLRALPEGPKHTRRNRRALSEDEITRFLAAAEADDSRCVAMFPTPRIPQAPLWRAFLETGCRYGELVAATWADVDLDARVLVLRGETTKAGRPRAIPLGERLVNDFKGLQFAQHRVLGRAAGEADQIFLTPDGKPGLWHTSNLRRIFLRLIEEAGIAKVDAHGRQIDIHALRHTFASRLARNGVGIAQAQRLMGHADPKLTARVYTHLGVEELRGAIASLSAPKPAPASQTKEARADGA